MDYVFNLSNLVYCSQMTYYLFKPITFHSFNFSINHLPFCYKITEYFIPFTTLTALFVYIFIIANKKAFLTLFLEFECKTKQIRPSNFRLHLKQLFTHDLSV